MKGSRILVGLLQLGLVSAFLAPFSAIPRSKSRTCIAASRRGCIMNAQNDGLHGTGSRFLSISQLKGDELMPRIVQIAGVYPGITAEELLAPRSSESPGYGRWAYDFSDPDGPQMGTVALPASELVHACVDPVVVIASSNALGLDLAEDNDIEALVLIDRGDRYFQSNKFYAFARPNGELLIRWFDSVPQDYTILGKVQYVTLPFLKKSGSYSSGWLEADEE